MFRPHERKPWEEKCSEMADRPQDVVRRAPITLVNKEIPRNDNGDPNFTSLSELQKIFADDEIVTLVNRQIYSLEYQRIVHRERTRDERQRLKPLKDEFKRLFPGTSFLNATPAQLDKAAKSVKERRDANAQGENPQV